MPGRRGTRPLGLAGAVVLILALAGCGSSDGGKKIPPEDADAMLASAAAIRQAAASRQCDEAQAATTELRGSIGALPDETDQEIVDALDQMVSRLDEELDAECADTGTTDTEETTETTETTVEPTTATTTTEPTTTEEPPPEEEEEDGGPPVQPPGQGGSPPGQAPEDGGGTPSGGIEEEE